jgi:hypothetical protein
LANINTPKANYINNCFQNSVNEKNLFAQSGFVAIPAKGK